MARNRVSFDSVPAAGTQCSPKIAAMFVWLSEASTLASRSKRASRSASAAKPSGRTLIATSRSSVVSTAFQTTPIPPSPIFSTMR